MLLEGRRTLITGASSGIGKATAQRFGAEGASVCVNYYSEKEKPDADAICREIDPAGTRAFSHQADVGDEAQVTAMVAVVVANFGGIDVLVNNAGIEKQVPTLEMPLDLWNAVLRTNLTGAFLCLREAGRHMADQKSGVIVNVSSVHEFIPWPGFAHYCASKGGMKLLTQTVRLRARRPRGQAHGGGGDPAGPVRPARRDRRSGGVGGQRPGGVCDRHHAGGGRRDVHVSEVCVTGIPNR
jgi:glucose 1-dehydrogenase